MSDAPNPRPSAEKDAGWAGRMLDLPAPDEPVSQLHMRAVADLIDQWEADDENDNYSKGDAATDLRNALAAACTCRALPHDKRCPTRVIPPGSGDAAVPPPTTAAPVPCTHPNCHAHGKSPCEGIGCGGREIEENPDV